MQKVLPLCILLSASATIADAPAPVVIDPIEFTHPSSLQDISKEVNGRIHEAARIVLNQHLPQKNQDVDSIVFFDMDVNQRGFTLKVIDGTTVEHTYVAFSTDQQTSQTYFTVILNDRGEFNRLSMDTDFFQYQEVRRYDFIITSEEHVINPGPVAFLVSFSAQENTMRAIYRK